MKTRVKTLALSLLVMALWGSLFPFVKIGYRAFGIDAGSIPDILLFAGMRFALSGLVVSLIALARKETLAAPRRKSIGAILLMGLFSIVLHYAFTYIGLSSTDGSKTALIKQLGPLIYVCFSFLFFKNEKFSILKIAGAVLGFGGIIAINYTSAGIRFSTGDILILLASVCTVVSSIINKKTTASNSPFWITGISQLAGGMVLLAVALAMGGKIPVFDYKAALVFGYICTASVCAYVLYSYLLRTSSLSKMFIIKFAEPLFACLFGAVLLGENIFKVQYLLAFVLISGGIILGNKSEGKK